VHCSSRPYSRIRSHCQSPGISQWTAALQSPSTNKLRPSDYSTPREMSLPADTPLAIADALGYLQHHLQELTECQNTLEHTINATLVGLTAQLQQLTQLITAPAPTVAPSPIPTSLPLISPPSPVPSAPSKQWTRPKLSSPPDFSSEWSSSQAFFNSCTLYLRLAPEQFSYDEEKILWTLAFFKDGRATRWSENLFRQETDTSIFPIQSWAHFKQQFQSQFFPVNM